MTSRRFKLAHMPRWSAFAALLVVLTPSAVFATHFELSRLASQVELISAQLAEDLRYTRHYGSVRSRAVTLRREAAQLADSLRRDRSNSRIRSRFKDVRRGYERLEQAFFIADRRDHDPRVFDEIALLSNVFTNLSDEFYYAGFDRQSVVPIYAVPYGGVQIIGSRNSRFRDGGSRHYGLPNFGARNPVFRNPGSRQYNNRGRDYDSGSIDRIVPNRERAVPPVFRGNTGQAKPNWQGGRVGRVDRGSRSIQSVAPSGHRSNVLERQGRQNSARRELEGQARRNRTTESTGRSSRGTNVQRGRSGSVQSRRRNQ